ncbi:MAG: hypothetical protein KGR70_14920 [Cyanobacteria bacterium REEB494]|nr:hypothetical protein [Cyanobacteria bacterium REEB494]
MNQYIKIILTVIAFLLCVVVGQNALHERAEGQQLQAMRVFICGDDSFLERNRRDLELRGRGTKGGCLTTGELLQRLQR